MASTAADANPSKQRFYLYDNLKFLLIMFVVIGHFADELTVNLYGEETGDPTLPLSKLFNSVYLFLYAFHMPLFMFISGLFHKTGDKLNGSKALTYFILGMLLKMLLFLSKVIFRPEFEADFETDFSLIGGDGAYWYLIALSAFVLITYAVRNANPALIMVFSILLTLVSGYDNTLGDDFTLSRIVVFFPFFYAGYLCSPEKIYEIFHKAYMKIAGVILIAVWAYFSFVKLELCYPMRRIFTGRNSFDAASEAAGISMGFEHRLLAEAIAFLLCGAFIAVSVNKKIPFITSAGSRTLQVYFWHRPVQYALVYFGYPQFLALHFPNHYELYYILTAAAVTVILSLKPFGAPLNYIVKNIAKYKK